MKKLSLLLLSVAFSLSSMAAVTITKTAGWFESGYVTWTNVSGLTYQVFVRPEGGTYTQLDKELVRNYGDYGRADALGLKAGLRLSLRVLQLAHRLPRGLVRLRLLLLQRGVHGAAHVLAQRLRVQV